MWGNADISTIMKEVREAGYEGLEATMPKIADYLNDPARFKDMLSEAGLQMASVYVPGNWHVREEHANDLANCRAAAEFASFVGCKQLILSGGIMRLGDNERDALHETAACYNEIGRMCMAEYGLEVCCHPIARPGATVGSPAQIAEIMDTTDPKAFFLCPDVGGHIVLGGGDPVEIFRLYADRIRYVHFKDIDADGKWTLLGRGVTDYPRLIEMLREMGYDGWLTAEEECSEAIGELGPLECAKRNCAYVRSLL